MSIYGQVSAVDFVRPLDADETSCVPLLVPPDNVAFLQTAAEIYAKHDRYPEALALAVRLNDRTLIRRYYDAPQNP